MQSEALCWRKNTKHEGWTTNFSAALHAAINFPMRQKLNQIACPLSGMTRWCHAAAGIHPLKDFLAYTFK